MRLTFIRCDGCECMNLDALDSDSHMFAQGLGFKFVIAKLHIGWIAAVFNKFIKSWHTSPQHTLHSVQHIVQHTPNTIPDDH